jgi:transcriptional regulator with XRE-family HTH domain
MIGLEKVIQVFNLNANQIAKKLGVSRQTVYDWLKGKRKIPKKRIEQLANLPEFKFVNKELFQKEINEIDKLDIELAYINFLSDKDSEVIEDEECGVPYHYDPYAQERSMLLDMNSRAIELRKAETIIYNNEFIEDLRSETGELYAELLGRLNNLFQKQKIEQIRVVDILLTQLSIWGTNDKLKNELARDLKQVLIKHKVLKDEIIEEEC